MTEHLLDVADVCAVVVHKCCHAVAEHMAGAALADIGFIHMRAYEVAQMIETERLAGIREKHRVIVRFHHKLRPRFTDILFYPGGGAIADRNHPIPFAFPLPDRDRTALCIKIVEFQVGQFQSPHAGGIKCFHQGSVSQAQWNH